MRVHIASDIHGSFRELACALGPGDTALLLGDFINIIDYSDFSGILSEIIERPIIEATLRLIQEKKMDEAKAMMTRTNQSVEEMYRKVGKMADACYRELFGLLPCKSFIINGNVDFPALIEAHIRPPAVFVNETLAIDLDGRRLGFVAGHPHMAYSFGMPGEVTPAVYRERLRALGAVDHLFVHPPPTVRELSYDAAAQRDEGGSEALLEYVEDRRPMTVHFGHVHNPIRREMTIGKTRLVNVGCFRDEKRMTIFEW